MKTNLLKKKQLSKEHLLKHNFQKTNLFKK